MNKLFQNESFNLGFWSCITLFGLLNIFSYKSSNELPIDSNIRLADVGGYNIGFPFTLYKAEYGYPFQFYFVWTGLISDILICLIFSLVIGLTLKIIWSKISSQHTA